MTTLTTWSGISSPRSSIPHRRLQKITVMQIIEVIDTSAIQMFIRRHPHMVRLRCRRPV